MELEYPIIILIAVIAIVISLFLKKKKVKYKTGVKKANLKFLENNSYYKRKKGLYKTLSVLLIIVCILLILSTSVLSARLVKRTSKDETYNRDIMLCMDVSTSVDALNKDVVLALRNTVDKLSNDRFGISVFNITSITLSPLTGDYKYVSSILEMIAKSIDSTYSDGFYTKNYLTEGTASMDDYEVRQGSSFVGEGLVTCANHFDKSDKNRTKVIILTTDNEVQGTPLITLKEGAEYCKRNNIIVYGIGIEGIKSSMKSGFKSDIELTGGKYFDIKENSSNIIREIDSLEKTRLENTMSITKTDMPEILFIITLVLSMIVLIIDWRLKV